MKPIVSKKAQIYVYPTKTAKKKDELRTTTTVSGLGEHARSTNKLKALMSKLNQEPVDEDSEAILTGGSEVGI